MSKQTEPGSAFAPASGYALVVDAALKTADAWPRRTHYTVEWLLGDSATEIKNARGRTPEQYPEVAAVVLAAEVRRLRAEVARLEAHNEVAEGRPLAGKGGTDESR